MAFIFQIGSTLTTAADSTISVINGGLGDSIFWQVGSSATLGASSLFLGNILADTSITLDPFAQIACGRALAGIVTASGTVTMANANGVSISNGASCVSGYDSVSSSPAMVPEPGTLALLFAGLAGITAIRMRLGSPSPAPMQEKIDGV